MFGFGKKRLELLALISGRVIPLDEVSDAVFSQRMLGDGIAIEPDGDCIAPATQSSASMRASWPPRPYRP